MWLKSRDAFKVIFEQAYLIYIYVQISHACVGWVYCGFWSDTSLSVPLDFFFFFLMTFKIICIVYVLLLYRTVLHSIRPDVTVMVDWALKIKYLIFTPFAMM